MARMVLGSVGRLLVLSWLLLGQAHAADPTAWFDKAVQVDLGGSERAARSAFAWYLKAAEAGLPEAEFNIAVMLDSGRGVTSNLAQAATWYARAASHGNRRAAYNLGQLYEAGQGVPKNAELAQAWFQLSGLPAARARTAVPASGANRNIVMSAPLLLGPTAGASVTPGIGGVELVWTSQSQPEPVKFFVELRALRAGGSQEVFSGFAETSSILAAMNETEGDFAWRVLAVGRESGRYSASGWQRFSVVEPQTAAD